MPPAHLQGCLVKQDFPAAPGGPPIPWASVFIFRSVVADSAALTAINRGVVGADDFEYNMGGCFLNGPGRKKFYRAYEERRLSEIKHPVFDYRLTYLRVFELQARILGKFLQGELDKYIPFVVR